MRHFAIYNQPWPRRVPAHGAAFSVTPREESTPSESNKRVNPKTLPVLDRKLADAASAGKRSRKEDEREEEPVPKRRKIDTSLSAVLKPKQTSSSVTSMNKSTSSPSAVSDKMSPALSKTSIESSSESKRRRGRPRLSDKLLSSVSVVKAEEMTTHIPPKSLFSQPRNTNGRFGRKDTLLKAQQRAARAVTTVDGSSPPRKERLEPPQPTRSSPRKRRAIEDLTNEPVSLRDQSSFLDDEDEKEVLPIQRVLPRRGLNFKGASLVSNPNPLRFALQAWANPVLRDETSSSDDDLGPETPEDHYSPPSASILDLEHDERDFPMSAPPLPRAPLTHKPSPLTFAKRRWASTSLSPLEDDSRAPDLRRPFVMEQAGQKFANEVCYLLLGR
jgi:histone-lysine N-methyltransferase SUV420H